MSQTSPSLALPLIQAAQAQKHVTHNEAVELLDLLVQLVVQAFDATTPPGTASEGQAWTIGAGASGAWSGRTGQIASWRGGGWLFVIPSPGWRAWGLTEAEIRVYSGANWVASATGGGSGLSDFNNLDGVGINATSDTINKLVVAAEATLLNHDGAGHQLKLNKSATADTASLLYQTGFSGRAEMGLAGTDDFAIKVSPDGSSFTEALRIDATNGAVTMPTSPVRQILPYQYRHYLYSDLRWTAPVANGGSWNASQSLGTGAEPNVDWDARGLFLPAGSQVHGLHLAGNLNNAEPDDLDLRIYFQHGAWDGSRNTNGETSRDTLYSQNTVGITAGTAMQRLAIPLSYSTPEDGYLFLALRPSAGSILTNTRYAQLSGGFDVACARLF